MVHLPRYVGRFQIIPCLFIKINPRSNEHVMLPLQMSPLVFENLTRSPISREFYLLFLKVLNHLQFSPNSFKILHKPF
jgi:hypothetical protein